MFRRKRQQHRHEFTSSKEDRSFWPLVQRRRVQSTFALSKQRTFQTFFQKTNDNQCRRTRSERVTVRRAMQQPLDSGRIEREIRRPIDARCSDLHRCFESERQSAEIRADLPARQSRAGPCAVATRDSRPVRCGGRTTMSTYTRETRNPKDKESKPGEMAAIVRRDDERDARQIRRQIGRHEL